jgi:hypothetical protein
VLIITWATNVRYKLANMRWEVMTKSYNFHVEAKSQFESHIVPQCTTLYHDEKDIFWKNIYEETKNWRKSVTIVSRWHVNSKSIECYKYSLILSYFIHSVSTKIAILFRISWPAKPLRLICWGNFTKTLVLLYYIQFYLILFQLCPLFSCLLNSSCIG